MKPSNNTIKTQKISPQHANNWLFPFPLHSLKNFQINTFYQFNHPFDYLYPHSTTNNADYFRNAYHPQCCLSHLPNSLTSIKPFLPPVKIQNEDEDQNIIKLFSEPLQIRKIKLQNIQKSLQCYSQSEVLKMQNFMREIKSEKEITQIKNEPQLTYTKPYAKDLISIFTILIQKLIDEDPNFKEFSQKCQRQIIHMSQCNEKGKIETKQQMVRKELFFLSMINILSEKYKKFKKTKEEMIKYIIRRTYHNLKVKRQLYNKPQYDRLEIFHQKNIITYKSMNANFLRRQFANPLFLCLYKQFLSQMDTQLEEQNQEKILKLSHTLSKCWTLRSSHDLATQKKLPWVMSYKVKVKKIAYDMLKIYECYNLKEEIKRQDEIQ